MGLLFSDIGEITFSGSFSSGGTASCSGISGCSEDLVSAPHSKVKSPAQRAASSSERSDSALNTSVGGSVSENQNFGIFRPRSRQ